MKQTVRCAASPSLALIKYWGKRDGLVNVPATTSIAVTLSHLETITEVRRADGPEHEQVVVNGMLQDRQRFTPFFDQVRATAEQGVWFDVQSSNSFPTGAGLASSSSAFAALALGCSRIARQRLEAAELSQLARVGSGSAARAVYGGFTRFAAGAFQAEQIADQSHWSDLRVVIAVINPGPKSISSRDAMNRTRDTSVFYPAWVETSEALARQAERAILARDLNALGATMRQSYLRMFSTMFTAEPPVLYWLPETVAVIQACEQLRRDGVPAWETMDAGPQVKVFTTARHVSVVSERISRENSGGEVLVVGVGAAPRILADTDSEPESDTESDSASGAPG